ncbi:CBD9-like protein [Setomelanomma holmii]|uniref:CBD9-like protein n=1 Tax=Setomelanomma holmii TaxID=210430 RepID=A0A9P4LGN9_9PLEO|nr:CBD9-like protein [Setomelanomma holmii]
MKIFSTLIGAFVALTAAQTPGPYTDAMSGITFNTFQHGSGYFFGLALPQNTTGNADFIATIGGKGTGFSGISLGGGMLSKLLLLAWPDQQAVVSSFRKTANYGSPAIATGTFTQIPITNGTYVNSTHWTYTFLCSKCIQSDGTTFENSDTAPSIGWALNANGPAQKANPAASVSKHTSEGQVVFDLSKAKSSRFDTWKSWAKPTVARRPSA